MSISDLVLKLLSVGAESDEGKVAFENLKSLEKSIVNLAITYEKPGVTKTDWNCFS